MNRGVAQVMGVAGFFGLVGGLAGPAAARPLKVFILAGQSNMQGHAHVSTFDAIGLDTNTAPLLREMRQPDGTPTVCERVWIASIGCAEGDEAEKAGKLTAGFGAAARGPKIGPEFTFGLAMQKRLDEPILLVKTAWGGKSLNTDFRPPSAGTYAFTAAQIEQLAAAGKDVEALKAEKAAASGVYYRRMVDYVKQVLADPGRVCPAYDPQAGYELAGFVWFQGWNDMVDSGTYPERAKPGGYDLYTALLADFIRDVRRDLAAPRLPFVIGVLGVGGILDLQNPNRYTPIHDAFRRAMAAPAAMPEFRGNVAAVLTEQYWDPQLAELRARGEQIKAKAGELGADKALTPAQRAAALEAFKATLYTPHERELLKGGSNFDFHYMGSAKVMARIGTGFAEAMRALQATAAANGEGQERLRAAAEEALRERGGAPRRDGPQPTAGP